MIMPRLPSSLRRLIYAWLCCLIGLPCVAAYTLTVTPDRPRTMYAVNQEIRFLVRLEHDGAPVTSGEIVFLLDEGARDERNGGTCSLGPEPVVLATARSEPGIVRCHVSYTVDAQATLYAMAVVGVGLEQLLPSRPPPADFDEYWETQRTQLAALPISATSRPVPASVPNVDCQDIAITFLPNKAVKGYLARPANAAKGSLPAILWLPFAGVGSAYQYHAVRGAELGALSLAINIFGMENGLSPEHYAVFEEGMYKRYPLQGRENRDTYFYRDAYLMAWRALDYLASRPEWNGKMLAVFGSSQGGALALAAGAFDRRVTLIAAAVPAMCDHTAFTVGRPAPWPDLIPREADEATQARVSVTAGYYDSVNFARRCTARTLFSVGFFDTVSPPTSVYAAYNQLPGKKDILREWTLGHECSPEFEQAFLKAVFPATK